LKITDIFADFLKNITKSPQAKSKIHIIKKIRRTGQGSTFFVRKLFIIACEKYVTRSEFVRSFLARIPGKVFIFYGIFKDI
jgi:hypothetical protein